MLNSAIYTYNKENFNSIKVVKTYENYLKNSELDADTQYFFKPYRYPPLIYMAHITFK